ncbi:MAG: serine/threonine-protein kinase [Planctomycetota bacterium]
MWRSVSQTRPGLSIDRRFDPVSLLGRGGMGEVWLVRDRRTGQHLALKRVSQEDSCGPIGTRHCQEFRQLAQLRHPSILAVHDYGVDPQDGTRWFSSEVLRGRVSTDIAGQLTLQQWFEMCKGTLSALAFLHRNGWVHGDIKSDNVRLRNLATVDGQLDPVLLDFGLSHQEGHPLEQKILGTPHAMPPEQWLGERPDFLGDVYSAGILFYQWWCGRVPFGGSDRSRLGRAHLQEDVPDLDRFREGLPQPFQDCLAKMLEKRPDDRPRDAGEVLHMLERKSELACQERVGESRSSLLAQIQYGGPAPEHVEQLKDALDVALQDLQDPGIVLHLHRRGGDRKSIVESVRSRLLSEGIPVIPIDARALHPMASIEAEIAAGSKVVIVELDDPGLGNVELAAAMKQGLVAGTRILWWVNSAVVPGGFLGAVFAQRRTKMVKTNQAMELGVWLQRALPDCTIPPKLRSRLDRWGQGSPAIWERILKGRIEAGELTHDGLRWGWKKLSQNPEDRWRVRVCEEAARLPADERSILEALSILGTPATPSDVIRVAGLELGLLPSLAARLVQKRWIRIDGDLKWAEPFQSEGILIGISAERRKVFHQRASLLTGLSLLQQARHRLSGGDPESAACCLEPWLKDEQRCVADPEGLVEVLTPLIDLLPDEQKAPWAELLGRAEDLLGETGRRDRAWRIGSTFHQCGSVEELRLARWRAHTSRRDGNPQAALRIIEEVQMPQGDGPDPVIHEAVGLSIEKSRILRTLARRGQAEISAFEAPAEVADLSNAVRLEQCRCALARGARLQAIDLADRVIEEANRSNVRDQKCSSHSIKETARRLAEAQCLRSRAKEDLRSLRLWSRLHQQLCLESGLREAAVVAGIESAESIHRLGDEQQARSEISDLVKLAREFCCGQLPRALLLLARCEAGAGWIRSASVYLEEALSLDGPAGIVAWEGNLLVAASEWAAGRSVTARKILTASLPSDAPHERESIDVHSRHAILESRCAFSCGEPQEALRIVDHGVTLLRLRGTAHDLAPLRRERVKILESLGHTAMAQLEQRRIVTGSIFEAGADPEPTGLRRARQALDDRRLLLMRGGPQEEAEKLLESAALDVLRLRAQPLSSWLSLQRSSQLSPRERDRIASSAWKRACRMETREGRAAVLLWWAQSREQSEDLVAGSRLRSAALREVDRWREKSPAGTRWNKLADLLGVPGLGSEALPSRNGGRNSALA